MTRSPSSATPATTSRCSGCGSAPTSTPSCTPSAAASTRSRAGGGPTRRFAVKDELAAYGMEPQWFGLGDRDIATHVVRTQMLDAGYPLSAVTEALCARWQPGVRLLPMTDDRVETHVSSTTSTGRRAIHFQEWWVRLHAATPALAIVPVGADDAKPAPGVLEAIAEADLVLLPPSNPVVSIGTILAVPGIRDGARSDRRAGGRGLADHRRRAGARHGRRVPDRDRHRDLRRGGRPRTYADLLDGWLVDDGRRRRRRSTGVDVRALPLLMTDDDRDASHRRARRSTWPPSTGRRVTALTEVRISAGRGPAGGARPGDDLAALIAAAVPDLADGDIVVVTSKVVSKAEGRYGPAARPRGRDRRARPCASSRAAAPTRIVETRHGLVHGRGRRRREQHRARHRGPAARRPRRQRPPAPRRAARADSASASACRQRHLRPAVAAGPHRRRDRRRRACARSTTTAAASTATATPLEQTVTARRRRGRRGRRAGQGQARRRPGRRRHAAWATWSPPTTGRARASLVRPADEDMFRLGHREVVRGPAYGPRVHRRAGRPRPPSPRRRRRDHRPGAAPHDAVALRPRRVRGRTDAAARRDGRAWAADLRARRLQPRSRSSAGCGAATCCATRRTRRALPGLPPARTTTRTRAGDRRARDVPRRDGRRGREPVGRAGRRGPRARPGCRARCSARTSSARCSTCPPTGTRWAPSPSATPPPRRLTARPATRTTIC